MKTITTYIARNRNFTIVKDGEHYCAIEDKYIDENGRLTKTLNGLQMYASRVLDVCIENVKNGVELDYLTSQGMSKAEAMVKVLGLPEEMVDVLAKVV